MESLQQAPSEATVARGRRKTRVKSPVPLRRCVACRGQKPRSALLRVAGVEGKAVFDARAALPGRGAWLCKEEKCLLAAVKMKAVSRALKGKGRDPSAEELRAWVAAAKAQGAAKVVAAPPVSAAQAD
jgi:predicted RNA-binding protein YlxR (DUF448 family)